MMSWFPSTYRIKYASILYESHWGHHRRICGQIKRILLLLYLTVLNGIEFLKNKRVYLAIVHSWPVHASFFTIPF